MSEKDRIVRALHLLLSELHLALATNRTPRPEVVVLAASLSDWWCVRTQPQRG